MFGLLRKLEDAYAAVAFAEANEWKTASEILNEGKKPVATTFTRKKQPARPRLGAGR